ncbi:hypothetical protein DFP90_106133 [Aestuariispira insulae]|uniref:AsmA-like protein n=2 Tax=Aestuariispira insulae TaxID=1461337 RepID=A0A3D9HI99_9PROT|nr:hypothetical protein DFP90_106133 [Aestuariispira insulae]
MKKILIGLVVIVAVIAGGAYYVFSNLDKIVETAVEEAGSQVTKVDVTLDGVRLELTEGNAALNGLQVGNPDGFKTDYAMALGTVSVSVDTSSVGQDVIVVREVVVDGPAIIYELSGTDSNIAAIQKNVESFTSAMGGSGGSSAESTEEGAKVVIENLYIRNGEVAVSAGFLDGEKMGVGLPEIHLTDIGKDSGGATPAEVAAKVLDAISTAVISSVATLDLGSMVEGAGAVMEGAGDAVKGVTEGAGESVGGAVEGAADAVKGLFGGDSN